MRYIAETSDRDFIESFDTYKDLLVYFSYIGGIIYIYDFLTFQKKTIIINTHFLQCNTTEKIDQIIWF
jgi:hypothetical protein